MILITNTTLLNIFNTTWLNEWILMESRLDRNEKLFLLAPIFSFVQKCGEEREVEITVFLDFLL